MGDFLFITFIKRFENIKFLSFFNKSCLAFEISKTLVPIHKEKKSMKTHANMNINNESAFIHNSNV